MKRWLACLCLFFAAAGFGELRNFEKNGISYEWEEDPDFYLCKMLFSDAFIHSYSQVPLEELGFYGRASMVQKISDAFDAFYLEFKSGQSGLRWLTAKEGGVPVGVIVADLSKFPEEIYIAEMAVETMHQRQGIATAMVSALLEQFPEAARFTVITRKANRTARAFYSAFGFIESGYTHEGYSPEWYAGYEYSPK